MGVSRITCKRRLRIHQEFIYLSIYLSIYLYIYKYIYIHIYVYIAVQARTFAVCFTSSSRLCRAWPHKHHFQLQAWHQLKYMLFGLGSRWRLGYAKQRFLRYRLTLDSIPRILIASAMKSTFTARQAVRHCQNGSCSGFPISCFRLQACRFLFRVSTFAFMVSRFSFYMSDFRF